MIAEIAAAGDIIPVGAGQVLPGGDAKGKEGEASLAPTTDIDIYSGLKDWQRDVLAARLLVLRSIDEYRKATGRSLNKAIEAFLTAISNGGPTALKHAAKNANHRRGYSRVLNDKTIYRWHRIRKIEGNIGLAPADKDAGEDIPLWLPEFLEAYRQPSKPSVAEALRDMGTDAPPYHQVIRCLKKFSTLDLHRGRMSGSELRAIRAYIKRDFSDLLPMDIIVADGHSFKAYVAHPVHGKRFLPEVEAVICVATRYCVGWSTGLSESGQVVADALRHAATVNDDKPMGGLFAILYTDNGAGNRAKMNSDEVTGIVSRLGGTIKFGIAGNPQGRGVIERLNASLWIPSAKKLITYNGKGMDQLALRKRLKIVDKDLKENGASRHLLSWPQFIDFLAEQVQAYNNRPHSSLPKIIDAGGHKRHMTPAERWQVFMAEGWQPDTLNPEEMRDLFRPQIQCTTRRGLVTAPGGNEYFSAELEHHHGEPVFVNYDIHDPRIVWVRDRQQRLICEAHWNANRRAYFPKAVVEQAREKRKERRLALKHEQIREIEEEARGVVEIPEECVNDTTNSHSLGRLNLGNGEEECVSGSSSTCEMPSLGNQTEIERFEAPQTSTDECRAASRPFFQNEIERYEWHEKNGVETEEDAAFCAYFRLTDTYRMLFH